MTMSPLLKFLSSFSPLLGSRPAEDDAFLAGSVDIYDLERRMRAIEDRARNPFGGIALGLYTR
jgi:hypothetical protein